MRALLITDVQQGFLRPEYADLPERIAARAGDYDLVLASRFANQPGSLYRRQLDWHRLGDELETLLCPAIAALNPIVIEKSGYSALTPELAKILERQQIDAVDLCGIDTDQCVAATAFALFDAGIFVRVLQELCASSGGLANHTVGLIVLERALGNASLVD